MDSQLYDYPYNQLTISFDMQLSSYAIIQLFSHYSYSYSNYANRQVNK